tara:strand:- start:5145 stop:7505 length:2361 start_codon:yes stop_codon:yes gene_type:complete
MVLLNFACTAPKAYKELNPSLVLWYDKPANNWNEALPVGNGRLGAMVYGVVKKEVIQFNEETLWTGQPHDYAHEGSYKVLDTLRQLLREEKQNEAHKLGNKKFMSQPLGQFSYQPFGNIELHFKDHENVTNYKRNLDLENAIASIEYIANGSKIKREVFTSVPDQALIVQIESSQKGQLNFDIDLVTPHSEYEVLVERDEIILRGKANNYHEKIDYNGLPYPESKVKFEARLKVVTEGGNLTVDEGTIKISGANKATLKLVAATNFLKFNDINGKPTELCANYLKDLNGKSYDVLRERHINDYKNLFSRVELDLGKSEISNRPTNQRLISFQVDEDPNMVALLYNYGRYLLIASSREGTQPANLQGIWNDQLSPPWDSKYTININTEMNYWLAEMTNLSELTAPLIQMVEDLSITGKNIAKEHYDLDGWVAHHNTDIWRGAAPINNANHGIWVTGGAWLSQHVWWHYEYTNDKDYLTTKAYPILKEASKFFVDYLVPDSENPNWLVSGPSVSPENGGLVMGPTMDHQIIKNLFYNTIEAADILGIDAEFVEVLKLKRAKIAPNLIGKYGQLQEWLEDKDDPKSEHRHVSHLWGLHPGNEIHPLTTPNLAEACKVSLSQRGDGGTGWSRGWKINFWARLLDGEHSFLTLKNLIIPSVSEKIDYRSEGGGGLYLNLLDSHPPFQIDGNFGASSGVTEMLLQSHLRDKKGDYFQDILPALPSALATGEISGLKGRGGFEISIHWENGELVLVKVISQFGNNLNLRHNGKLISLKTKVGQRLEFEISDFL